MPSAKGTKSPYKDPKLNPTNRVNRKPKQYDVFGNLIGQKKRKNKMPYVECGMEC